MAGEITNLTVGQSPFTRQAVEVTIDHTDPNTWGTPPSGDFLVEVQVNGGGFTTPANVQLIANPCVDEGPNPTGPDGLSQTAFAVFDSAWPAGATIDVRVTAQPNDAGVTGDTVTEQVTLPDPPDTFACLPSNITQTEARIQYGTANGTLDTTDCNADRVTWEWGEVGAGFPNTIGPVDIDGGSPGTDLTGLTPGTDYEYRATLTDAGGNPLPNANPAQTCTFTTTAQAAPTTPTTGNLTPNEDCATGGGAGVDVEQTLLCDVLDGEVVGTAVYVQTYDDEGNPDGAPTLLDPSTGQPYTVQGELQPCGEAFDTESHVLCDEQPDNSVVRFLRHYVYNDDNAVAASYDTDLAGAPYSPTGTVTTCEPATTCTPSPAVDLQAECGPGEAPDAQWIADQGVASDARVDTDANADPLCGGTWVRPGDPQAAPFPVEESFRNATFDQPGPVTQGTAPYPALTADPANHGQGNPPIPSDAAGQGWLRMSGLNSFTNGMWQVPTAFSTAQGMTFETTYASHGGTAFGGDGSGVFFTDGGVPPQAGAIGGGGSLGLGNWEGGYVGVILDEFGGTGAGANTISIQGIGANAGNIIAVANVGPNVINQTTRAQPLRLRVSIIEQFGQTFVSASIDWNDGNGPVQYFDRVRVDDTIGAAPASLRMAAYGGSGGAFRSNKDFRDAVANQGGVQYWRQFPIQTDPLDDCVETVDLTVTVDHTFDAASEATGNGEPDAWLWLVNVATGTLLAQRQWSSNPNNLGQAQERTITLEDIDPADLPNIRVMVGAETRDAGESFDHTFDNLRVNALGQGCPAEQVRTVPISAPCPIPVVIVGGDAEGGGGGTAEFESASTFQYVPICATVNGQTTPGWMREVRDAEGNVTRDFLGEDGIAFTPEAYVPGDCATRDTEIVELCDVQGNGVVVPFLRVFTYDEDGQVTSVENQDADGDPYTPTGQVTTCSVAQDVEILVLCDGGAGDTPFLRFINVAGGIPIPLADTELDGTTLYNVVGPVNVCASGGGGGSADDECLIDEGNGDTLFFRRTVRDEDGNITVSTVTVAGTPYTVTGPVAPCGGSEEARDFSVQAMCDSGVNTFFRVFVLNAQTGGVITTTDVDDDGSPYTPVGPTTVGICPVDADRERICYTLTSTGDEVHVGWARHQDSIPNTPQTPNGIAFFDDLGNFIDPTADGFTQVVCSTCCPEVIGEGCWNDGTDNGTWVSIRNADGTVQVIDPVTGLDVDPADVGDCPRPQYATTVREITDATFLIPGGGVNLVSWSVRARTAGVQLSVGGQTVTMDQGEVIESSTQDDTGTLSDAPQVVTQAGESARVVWLERS